jgi:hypothetical protein
VSGSNCVLPGYECPEGDDTRVADGGAVLIWNRKNNVLAASALSV